MTFSLIIPIYNVSAFLPECIDSVLAQSYTDWEIIGVDDGSTDDSGVILDQYAQQDPRIRAIHQVNGKQAAARNAAFDVARGEYIIMLDSDDVLTTDYLNQVAEVIRTSNPDLIAINIENWYPEQNRIVDNPVYSHPKPAEFESGKAYLNYFVRLKHWGPTGMFYVFRRSIIEQTHLRFEQGIFYEDNLFIPRLCYYAGKTVVCPHLKYRYRMREGSTMQSLTESKALDMRYVAHKQEEFWQKMGCINSITKRIIHNDAMLAISKIQSINPKLLTRDDVAIVWRNANWKQKLKHWKLWI